MWFLMYSYHGDFQLSQKGIWQIGTVSMHHSVYLRHFLTGDCFKMSSSPKFTNPLSSVFLYSVFI